MKEKIALAISGGGYRSTLFALGSLWRLNEFGLLKRMDRITSVSGGSIINAYLALRWKELDFDPTTEVSRKFIDVIVNPIRKFCSRTLDIRAGLVGLLALNKSIGDKVADLYGKWLYGSAKLEDIPQYEAPEFIFYAASLQTGDSVRISRDYIRDYKVGQLPKPKLSIAKVVGASSAFPPIFSPVILKCKPEDWEKMKGADLFDEIKYRKKMVLTDGGVYDNMGLEAVWNDGFDAVFVCDAGAKWKNTPSPWNFVFAQLYRVFDVSSSQGGKLRRSMLIDNFSDAKKGKTGKYRGAYWGTGTKIEGYPIDPMVKDNETTKRLQDVSTRLGSFSPELQGKLINWGYALTDAALRGYYFTTVQPKGNWPIPEYALDKYV